MLNSIAENQLRLAADYLNPQSWEPNSKDSSRPKPGREGWVGGPIRFAPENTNKEIRATESTIRFAPQETNNEIRAAERKPTFADECN